MYILYEASRCENNSEQVQVQTMALYKYFKPLDGLPDPSGPLSVSVCPAAINEANEALRTRGSKPQRKDRPCCHPHACMEIIRQQQQSRYLCKRGILSPLPLPKTTPSSHV